MATIIDRNLIGFLLDDRSYCNILYIDNGELLGIQQIDLTIYSDGDLLSFNDSVTPLRRAVDMVVTVGEKACERKVILNFLIILCKTAFRGIMGRSFLVRLDVVALPVNLKVTYRGVDKRSTIISANL